MKAPKKRVIQKHHIKYKERDGVEQTVYVWRGEHQILTMINLYTRKNVSKGFTKALRIWLRENGKRAKAIKPNTQKR